MSVAEFSKERIRSRLQEAIYHPTVADLFDVYSSSGCLEEYISILNRFSEPTKEMILETSSGQVHKEKSVIPYLIAKKHGFDLKQAVKIGAATETLWTLSVITDDVADNEAQRNGLPSMWVKYGVDTTKVRIYEALAGTLGYLADEVNPETALLAQKHIEIGIESLGYHKSMGLIASQNQILDNYAKRDGFHTFFPIEALRDWNRVGYEKLSSVRLGMALFNQAGQIANDTSDLRRSGGREARLNDLKEGRVTTAIAMLYDMVTPSEKQLLKSLFGAGRDYTDSERNAVEIMVERSQFLPRVSSRIVDTYERSRKVLQDHFLTEDFTLIEKWIEYKTEKYVR